MNKKIVYLCYLFFPLLAKGINGAEGNEKVCQDEEGADRPFTIYLDAGTEIESLVKSVNAVVATLQRVQTSIEIFEQRLEKLESKLQSTESMQQKLQTSTEMFQDRVESKLQSLENLQQKVQTSTEAGLAKVEGSFQYLESLHRKVQTSMEAGLAKLENKLQSTGSLQKNHPRLPRNCMEAAVSSHRSGIYEIQDHRLGEAPFMVWCDQETDHGGWIVIQRRVSADISFYRDWKTYKDGFGDLSGNYWIGLEKLHALTASYDHELFIKMESFDDEKYNARYDLFVIGSEEEDYVLKKVGNYSGNGVDAFKPHEGFKFTTRDRDNDAYNGNCAVTSRGGWWYRGCYASNLNGDYLRKDKRQGIIWLGIGEYKSLKSVKMMIRPTKK